MAPTASAQDTAERRRHMVEGQLRAGGVFDIAVLDAFLATPREAFVPSELAAIAYLDRDQPALGASARRLLSPLALGRLIQAASVAPGERALDVAGGSGFSAAILARMGAKVVALESDAGAANAARSALAGLSGVEVVTGDVAAGAPDRRPFDVILVNGACEKTPDVLAAQLADGGRLVCVEFESGSQEAVLIEKSAAGFSRRTLFETRVATLDEFRRAPSFAF